MSDKGTKASAYIVDFGSAAKLRSATDTLTLNFGVTEGYTAPEILLDKPYTYSVDVWSLGCLMHCLLFAKLPFQQIMLSPAVQEWLVCHKNFSLEANPGAAHLSQGCKDLLSSMLAKDPARRLIID